MSLKEYARKRDFKLTVEPRPKVPKARSLNRFVIQKHAASHLHYDFRLEMDGTLKSWAVPKGIPFAKGEKRLAMQVEDHPIGYIGFEGTIPKGQYGGGTVMVWDTGTYEPIGRPELSSGKSHFLLHGKKLEGEWYLVQMRRGKEWLLIRGGSDMKPVSKKQDDTSALSGKTMSQLAKSDQVWQSNAPEPSARRAKKPQPTRHPPKFIEPMKARLVDAPPSDEGWIYEVKFDGFRALAFKDGDQVHLVSRNQKDFTSKFPEVTDALAAVQAKGCTIDGEIVALDSKGRSSFQLLQALELGEQRPPIFYYAFDLLGLDGVDWRERPLEERKARLMEVLPKASSAIRFSPSLESAPNALLARFRKLGLEGMIGKRKGSLYEPGRRSGTWIKIKLHQEQEFVIGGFTSPKGTRKDFGALLVGHYDKKSLKFAGKVGTGFNTALLKSLRRQLDKISQDQCPFSNLPETRSSRYGQAITAAEMEKCHWVRPVMVCQLKFSEWTRDGKLRHPVFLGLRDDKDAKEVVRERPG